MEAKLEDLILDCEICSDKYDEGDRTPLTLPCGHTICKQCILNIYQPTKPKISCPKCKKNFSFNTDVDIPKNFTLLSHFDHLSKTF